MQFVWTRIENKRAMFSTTAQRSSQNRDFVTCFHFYCISKCQITHCLLFSLFSSYSSVLHSPIALVIWCILTKAFQTLVYSTAPILHHRMPHNFNSRACTMVASKNIKFKNYKTISEKTVCWSCEGMKNQSVLWRTTLLGLPKNKKEMKSCFEIRKSWMYLRGNLVAPIRD